MKYDLLSYISKYYRGSQVLYAMSEGVKPPQVTQWIKKNYIVIDHVLYSPRRNLRLYDDSHKQKELELTQESSLDKPEKNLSLSAAKLHFQHFYNIEK